MKKKVDVSVMEPLPGDIRELVLFTLQDARRKIDLIEDLLCEEPEEPETGEENE